ncbi:MAG: hybrid sensor histidine kinase/response regulator [Myxococcaceae bacterium]
MSLERPRVLVVDDDEIIRRLVKVTLAQKYEVFEAPDAPTAIELVGQHDIEVVVIDVMMPGMTGMEAVPKLRERAKNPIYVLLLTALHDQQSRNQGLEAGADDYLAKPMDRKELVLRVQNFVRLGRQERLIRQQLESLSQLQALKDDLTALLVHDLRNPLTAVSSAFQLMESSIPESERELFNLGKNALKRVMEGVSDLLKVRMLEKGELQLERSTFEPKELAEEVVQTLKAAALDGKIDVAVVSPPGVTLNADAKLLKRALENLLINAFRHTRGKVDVIIEPTADAVLVSVADRGPGVPDFLKGELFDMFGSLKLKESGGRRGHGLGLYLVRLVARAHGGDVVVKDRESGGAVFQLSFPKS